MTYAITFLRITCPNLIDLVLWSDCDTKDFILGFNGLKLERLSTNLTSLSPADFKEPAFAHITHLDVTSAQRSPWKALSSLPMLSHLAIDETVDIDILRQLLQRCKRLEILLAVNGGHCHHDWDTSNIILDPRFVMMKICRYMIEGWVDGASGKEYMWEWAERISALKKSKRSALIRNYDGGIKVTML